jgi:hypothetical protein
MVVAVATVRFTSQNNNIVDAFGLSTWNFRGSPSNSYINKKIGGGTNGIGGRLILQASSEDDSVNGRVEYENKIPSPASIIYSRRSFVMTAFSFGFLSGTVVGIDMSANAKYGDSTSMELPNYIEYLIEKNSVPDDSKVLYKGVDPATLLRRLQESESRLQEISTLAGQKKWTQINGIVTGPLGTLSITLNQIATSESTAAVKNAAKKVKADVVAIGQAASKKSADDCTKQATLASQDLKSLLQAAFE